MDKKLLKAMSLGMTKLLNRHLIGAPKANDIPTMAVVWTEDFESQGYTGGDDICVIQSFDYYAIRNDFFPTLHQMLENMGNVKGRNKVLLMHEKIETDGECAERMKYGEEQLKIIRAMLKGVGK